MLSIVKNSASEPPYCFKDASVFSLKDAECVGGEKEGEHFNKCSFFNECKEHVELQYASPAQSQDDDGMAAVEALEAELRACLR